MHMLIHIHFDIYTALNGHQHLLGRGQVWPRLIGSTSSLDITCKYSNTNSYPGIQLNSNIYPMYYEVYCFMFVAG